MTIWRVAAGSRSSRFDTVANTVRNGCRVVPVLRWLVEQGAPVGIAGDMEAALEETVERGLSARTVAWLRDWRQDELVAGIAKRNCAPRRHPPLAAVCLPYTMGATAWGW